MYYKDFIIILLYISMGFISYLFLKDLVRLFVYVAIFEILYYFFYSKKWSFYKRIYLNIAYITTYIILFYTKPF